MRHQIGVDVAIGIIRLAFEPYECVVRVYDFDRRLAFRVLDQDGKLIYGAAGISTRDVVDSEKLEARIEKARSQIQKKGRSLQPWTPPG